MIRGLRPRLVWPRRGLGVEVIDNLEYITNVTLVGYANSPYDRLVGGGGGGATSRVEVTPYNYHNL